MKPYNLFACSLDIVMRIKRILINNLPHCNLLTIALQRPVIYVQNSIEGKILYDKIQFNEAESLIDTI